MVAFSVTNGSQTYNGGSTYTVASPLVLGSDGNFYGVTKYGGSTNQYGTIFRLNVPLQPSFKSIVPTNSGVALSWSAIAGRTYQLQATADSSSTHWSNLGGSILATSGIVSYVDTAAPGTARFYHVQLTQ